MKTKLKIPNISKIKYILSCNFNVNLVLKVAQFLTKGNLKGKKFFFL